MKKVWGKLQLGEMVESVERFEVVETGVKYRQLGVRLWGGGAYEREQIDGVATQYTTFNRCESGDLVLNKIWARNGSITVVPPELTGCFVSSEFPIFRLKTLVLPGWLRIITKSRWFWDECNDQAYGTSGKNRIKPSAFLNITIPLPPIPEQQRIVAHLDAIETRLNRVKKLREQQEQELHALLASAFHKLEAKADWRFMSDVAPLAWREIDINPEKSYAEFGVRSFYKGIFLRRKVTGSTFSWQKLYKLQEGDIVFSNIMAWEKAIAITNSEHDGWVGNHRMLTCEPNREIILPSFLYQYFTTPDGFSKILQASPGTAARNKTLKAGDLMSLKVPVPSLAQQRTFEKLYNRVLKIRAATTMNFMEIDSLIPSMINRIFCE